MPGLDSFTLVTAAFEQKAAEQAGIGEVVVTDGRFWDRFDEPNDVGLGFLPVLHGRVDSGPMENHREVGIDWAWRCRAELFVDFRDAPWRVCPP